jgi:hypothetical protein
MAGQVIEKRKFVWKIKNFTRERYEKYTDLQFIKSDQFEISLGDNKTKW